MGNSLNPDAVVPDEQELAANIGKVAYSLDKAYMSRLSKDYDVIPFEKYLSEVKSNGACKEKVKPFLIKSENNW